MADAPLVWDELGKYKAEGRFLDGYPDDQRTFFAPRDDIHGLLVALLASAQHSRGPGQRAGHVSRHGPFDMATADREQFRR
jgi:hypothetical protein